MFGNDRFKLSQIFAFLAISLGVVGIGLSVLIDNPYSWSFPLAVLLGGVLFVATGKRPVRASVIDFPTFGVLALYFIVFAATVIVYLFEGYQRTMSVHVLTLGCYFFNAILLLKPVSVWSKLVPLLLTGVVQRAMGYYASVVYFGNDVLFHNRVAEEITTIGGLDPLSLSKYYYAPFFHLLSSIQSLITDLPVRHASFLSISMVLVVIPALAIYLITGRIWDQRTGLFGALLYTASDFPIYWSIVPQANSLGIVFFILAIFTAFQYVHTNQKRYAGLYFLAFGSVVLTHQLSSVITFVMIAIFFLFWGVFDREGWPRYLGITIISLILLLIDLRLTKINGPAGQGGSFLVTMIRIFGAGLQVINPGPGVSSGIPPGAGVTLTGSQALNIWHVAGTAILIGLGVFGGLRWLTDDTVSNNHCLAYGGILGILFPTIFIGPLIGFRLILPWRWFAFLYVPLVLLAAPGVVFLSNSVTRVMDRLQLQSLVGTEFIIIIVIFLLIGPYVFLMGGNFVSAQDDPPLREAPGGERYAINTPEKAMIDHSLRYVPESDHLIGDFNIAHNLLGRLYQRENVHVIHMETQNPDAIGMDETAFVLNRSYMQSGHVRFRFGCQEGYLGGEGQLVHGIVPVKEISPMHRTVIYESRINSIEIIDPINITCGSIGRS